MYISDIKEKTKHSFYLAALPHIISHEELEITAILQELLPEFAR